MDWDRTKKVKWSASKSLEFLSVDWIECDETIYENSYKDFNDISNEVNDSDDTPSSKHNKFYTIFVFGVTIEGYSVCAKIVNYNPYFYIKIPDLLKNNKKLKSKFEKEFFHKETLSFSKINTFENIYEKDTPSAEQLINIREKLECTEHKSSLLDTKINEKNAEIFWSFTNQTKYDF